MLKFVAPKVLQKQREFADLRYMIWCCINLRPMQMRYDDGFKLFVGALSPQYVDTTMAATTFNKLLDTLHDRMKQAVVDDLRSVREECLGMGYGGAFLGAQLDLTTVAGEEYITFAVSYVKKGDTDVSRVSLATRAFPGSHTADDIKPWIEALTLEYLTDLMGGSVESQDVFLAFTVDQGKNVVNACTALGVPVVECNCHRVNSAVLWALGIAGSVTTCKNKPMKKLAALVGVFSHSAVNNDMLKELQRLEADLHRIYETIRRNDTRWTSQQKMMGRLLILKKPISEYFRRLAQQNSQNKQLKRKLTAHEWTVTNEVCSLLETVSEVTIRMQGATDTHLSQATFIINEVIDMLTTDYHPIRVESAIVTPPPPAAGIIPTEGEGQNESSLDGISTAETQVTDLTLEAQDVVQVLLEVMDEKGVGKALQWVERLSVLLDPRRKTLDDTHLRNGSSDLKTQAEADLKAFIGKFAQESAPSTPAPAPVVNVDTAEPARKKKKPTSRLEQRRAARLAEAVAGGGGGSGTTDPKAAGAGRRVLIEREMLVYLAEQPQVDVDDFNPLGFWNRRGTDSVSAATGKVSSPAEMPYLAFIARLHLGIEATSCQAERNFSALAHLIGDLRCNYFRTGSSARCWSGSTSTCLLRRM
ncbi:unnamed protein product [Ectocarpus sp. CCAP 1310/34]|nr:unnamed protein product [Ectocarpus sp. CCAP 1310/34]